MRGKNIIERRYTALRIYDGLVSTDKFIGNTNCLIEIATWVTAQIEDKLTHSLRLQIFHRIHELLMRCLGKPTDSNVTGCRIDHEMSHYARDRDDVASDRVIDRLRLAEADDA